MFCGLSLLIWSYLTLCVLDQSVPYGVTYTRVYATVDLTILSTHHAFSTPLSLLAQRQLALYSLAEKKTYTLTLPDPPLCSRYIFGSSYGWIVTADERSELHIVNPITGDQIALPSVTTIDQVKPIFSDIGVVCGYEHSGYSGVWEVSDIPSIFDLSELRDHLFHKVFLSSDPSAGDYFMTAPAYAKRPPLLNLRESRAKHSPAANPATTHTPARTPLGSSQPRTALAKRPSPPAPRLPAAPQAPANRPRSSSSANPCAKHSPAADPATTRTPARTPVWQ
uniref:KIB1-4 beta-propeller domain-containing protein n=1 Tax=Zea mays TaxID=4577 RepID=A0A804M0A2_MAIZE